MSKPVKSLSFLLCLFLLISVNSCKKDLLVQNEDVTSLERPPSGVSLISFGELQKRIKITKSGVYNSVLANNQSKEGWFQLREDIILLTDKITMITANGITTYTLAVEQKSGQRATFQNVVFVDRNGAIETHLLTYKASKLFASKLKIDKKAAFEGYVNFSILDNKKAKGAVNTVSAETCDYYTINSSVPYKCSLSGEHWPWDTTCKAYGQSNGGGYETVSKTVSVCTRTGSSAGTWVTGPTTTEGSGGGGSDGGSVPTYPTLPLNYNPDCDYGYSSVNQVKNAGVTTSSVGDGDCPYDDPNPAGLIANINKLTGILGLDWAKQEFLHEQDAIQGKTLTSDLISYLNVYGASPQNIDFGNWALNYLIANPTTDYWMFKDQHLGLLEGKDGEYDAAFWEDPNLVFQTKALPTLQSFLAAFPKIQNGQVIRPMRAGGVFSLVGGNMLVKFDEGNINYRNACAIRGSRALNYSGVANQLDEFFVGNDQKTEKGSDGLNYILAAKAFNVYMNKTYGAPSARLTSLEIGNDLNVVYKFLQGKTGIYTLVTNNSGEAGYSGHVDLIYNGQVLGGAAINPKGGIKYIEIWTLQ
ncbi:MAG TPA: T6SS effector amidase Tae4 family protein [Sphingobacteriaceae bacterium]|nr:T6SS effector amidase Tae4 family protein [Sphingobacteriaceae bacterium]